MNTPSTATSTPPSREDHPRPNTRSWLALLAAGVFEVGYALSVNGSRGFTEPVWSSIAVVFFLFTLLFLSIALRRIAVGIGYAIWAGIGAVGAAALGPVFFDETLTPAQIAWLAVIIAGVIWLKLADSPRRGSAASKDSAPA